MTNIMEGDGNDSLDSGSVFDGDGPPHIESADSIVQMAKDLGNHRSLPAVIRSSSGPVELYGVPVSGPPPIVAAPLIAPPNTEPLPPPFVEPASSRMRTVAPGEMAAPTISSPAERETVVLSLTDQVPDHWTSFMIQATDGSGRTMHIGNNEVLLRNGLQQIQLDVGGALRDVIVPIAMARAEEVSAGVRLLVRALFSQFPDGVSMVFRSTNQP